MKNVFLVVLFAGLLVVSCDTSTSEGEDSGTATDGGGGGGGGDGSGGSSDGGGGDGGGGSDDMGGGPQVTSQVDVIENTAVDEQVGQGRNGPGTSQFDQLDSNRSGYLAQSSCGTVGLLYRDYSLDEDPDSWGLVFFERATDGTTTTEVVMSEDGSPSGFSWSLLYDADCDPVVVWQDGEGYTEYTRGDDAWEGTEHAIDVAGLFGDDSGWVDHHSAFVGADGALHLFAFCINGESYNVIHGVRGDAGWQFSGSDDVDAAEVDEEPLLDVPSDINPAYLPDLTWETYQYAVDASGTVHAVFSLNRHLYWGRLAAGAWTGEAVQMRPINESSGLHDWDKDAAGAASLALDSSGEPAVAAIFKERVVTGSLRDAELRYYRRTGAGSWTMATVATEADGYVGGDGNKYTGDTPSLVFDGNDHPHIAFNDIASWHNDNGWNETESGQLRYALHNGNNWETHTLFVQPGQTESPNPLQDFIHPSIAVTSDGRGLYFAGMERVIDGPSLIYDNDVSVTYRGRFFCAESDLGEE